MDPTFSVNLLNYNNTLYIFGMNASNEAQQGTGNNVVKIKDIENECCSFELLNGTTKIKRRNIQTTYDDNGNIYLFGNNNETDSLLEVLSINDNQVENIKMYNPLSNSTLLEDVYNANITRTNDSIILTGVNERQNNKIIADVYEMKFGNELFTPLAKHICTTKRVWGTITTYQGYTYALTGSAVNEDFIFMTRFETAYYYPEYETYNLGDADGDFDVTIIDATMIQRYLANLINASTIKLGAADADKDSKISILDANKIQRILANLDKD